jgi:hypothetical protein
LAFHREKQNVSASHILQALADGEELHLSQCTITGVLDINRLFDAQEKFQTEKLSLQQDENRKILVIPQSIVFDKCLFEENVSTDKADSGTPYSAALPVSTAAPSAAS